MKLETKAPDAIGEELQRITRRAFIPILMRQIYTGHPIKYEPMPWYQRVSYAVRRGWWRVRDAWLVLVGKADIGEPY